MYKYIIMYKEIKKLKSVNVFSDNFNNKIIVNIAQILKNFGKIIYKFSSKFLCETNNLFSQLQ